ncbi:MAG: alpha/beta hydrolase [Burkholderiales bacterium]|nr:alpha/beta hydrolase [Burkholderiales bacterium]
MPPRRAVLAALGAAAGLGGCAAWRAHRALPLDTWVDDGGCPATLAPVLLVLLTGAHMAPQEMVQQGFIAAVRQRHLAVDVTVADANLRYAYDGTLLERLHDDVMAPARAAGWRRIWLGGISLGGYAALLYAMRNPGAIEGLTLIAPYLGRPPLLRAIAAAGGPAAWQRTAGPAPAGDIDHALWHWLAAPPAVMRPIAPPIWLGYGTEDRLIEGDRLLATLLPADRVATAPGGHDWPPWRALWARWLDRGLLPGHCPA